MKPEYYLRKIKEGLSAFGVKGLVDIELEDGRAVVTVNGEYFGIWDVRKATFVD